MNREIKFRAWDGEKMTERICIAGNGFATTWDDDDEKTHLVLTKVDWPLIQYTGLKDKNGKEIYEGDIIKSPFFDDINVAVEWDEWFAQFTFGGAEFNVEIKPENIEVIGNIYENPELLTPKP